MNAALAAFRDLHISPLGAVLLVLYALVIGGAVGSFLNVVAYRLPLGMSLSRPRSRCPKCEQPIRWYHNVPVVGWLILRGRCRDCGAAISPRYPLVELAVALASGLVVGSALYQTVEGEQFVYAVDLVGVALRLALIYLLFCGALLEFDGNRLPTRMFVVANAILLLGVVFVPELRPFEYLSDRPVPSLGDFAFAPAAALLLGLLLWPLFLLPEGASTSHAVARLMMLLLVGLTTGGLAVLLAAVFAGGIAVAAVWLAHFWPPARRLGWAAALLIATLLWMLIAGPSIGSNELVSRGEIIIGVNNRWQSLVATGIVAAILTLLGRAVHLVSPRSSQPSTNE